MLRVTAGSGHGPGPTVTRSGHELRDWTKHAGDGHRQRCGVARARQREGDTSPVEKNSMDMEIERLRIASHERIAGLRARSGQQLPAADANDEETEA